MGCCTLMYDSFMTLIAHLLNILVINDSNVYNITFNDFCLKFPLL